LLTAPDRISALAGGKPICFRQHFECIRKMVRPRSGYG
jgi:hypothetical protein